MRSARRFRAAVGLALVLSASLVIGPAHARQRVCPLVSDPQGDVVPGLVVAPLGDEPGLDILAVDVSVGEVRLSTTLWLTKLEEAGPTSGVGDYYDVTFRVGRATLWTHVFHWTLNTSFDAGWIDEDGTRHYFSGGRVAAGAFDPELGMVRVSYDFKVIEDEAIEGDPVIRKGTVISGITGETRRTSQDRGPDDLATSKATYRVGQGTCPPYRLDLRS